MQLYRVVALQFLPIGHTLVQRVLGDLESFRPNDLFNQPHNVVCTAMIKVLPRQLHPLAELSGAEFTCRYTCTIVIQMLEKLVPAQNLLVTIFTHSTLVAVDDGLLALMLDMLL